MLPGTAPRSRPPLPLLVPELVRFPVALRLWWAEPVRIPVGVPFSLRIRVMCCTAPVPHSLTFSLLGPGTHVRFMRGLRWCSPLHVTCEYCA